MTNTPKQTTKVYAPNIHLFAFHFCKDIAKPFSSNLKPNDRLLWQKCQEIFKKLNINESLEEIIEKKGYRVDLLKSEKCDRIFLSLTSQIDLNNETLTITGLAYPLRLHDTYVLCLNLRRPEKEAEEKTKPIDLDFFKIINPNRIFLRDRINSSLGQTLLLTFWKTPDKTLKFWQSSPDRGKLKELSDRCLQSFFHDQEIQIPPLNQVGELFNSPIFEYGIASQIEDYNHILVWIFCEQETDNKFQNCYHHLIDLFAYRNKIITAYQNSRKIYQVLTQEYNDISNKIDKIFTEKLSQYSLTENRLEQFKNYLQTAPQTQLEYLQLIRDLENYYLTIKTNTNNYQRQLQNIYGQYPQENLKFLESFVKEYCDLFCEQIETDLGYYKQGTELLKNAIDTIRGLVEIEQTERDRKLQEEIQAIGIGIATGAIFASSSGLMTQPVTWPWDKEHGKFPHPFLTAVLVSFIIAIIMWGLTKWGLIKWISWIFLKRRSH
ncbi:MAG: hypothetical protein AB4290_09865 [Spirulina sp.]